MQLETGIDDWGKAEFLFGEISVRPTENYQGIKVFFKVDGKPKAILIPTFQLVHALSLPNLFNGLRQGEEQ